MAKVSYVPFSQAYQDIFDFCGISLNTSDFGGNTGWDAAQFANAVSAAEDYLNDNYEESYDEWLDKLGEDYKVFYWSTEKPIYG